MDFLVHKFSDWLKVNRIDHKLVQVKGGYIIHFNDPDDELKKVITSLVIMIDTKAESENGLAVKIPLKNFTDKGEGIVLEEKYYASVINASYSAIRDYLYNKNNKS